ncbi:palmitoyltransferase, putative [Plasmodium relictum]|uniref:Palmitoyltransferase n=1 Tax=Plasmodium relictum TaxID=85471 RepID=A0A1J1HF33_PLARL|nr:palmitoyltransferase, putative [Plasmodium relictum]CRH02477.1 palmitoyltransferase, putative [Plasmodium relictum]
MKILKRSKSLERQNFDKINNVQIYGENQIHCKGFFISGPAFLTVISSFLMIFIPVGIFHAFTSTWFFEKGIYFVTFLNLFFFVLTIYSFFKTSFMDPGIIPRQKSVLNLYDVIIEQYRETQPPRQKEVLINGHFYKLKYCYTCNIYRGLRTVHCSICDNCVEKFDHHCPWVGNCIGARNYKYFVFFVLNLYILICITLSASIYKLVICINKLSGDGYNTEKIFIHIWRVAADSLILIIYTVLTLWFVIGLLCYHIYTILTNQTTYEQIKTFYQNDNPFNIGIVNNIKEVLFTKTRPSYINFVNPQLQVVDKNCYHNIIVFNDKGVNIEEDIREKSSSDNRKKDKKKMDSMEIRSINKKSSKKKKSSKDCIPPSHGSKIRIKSYNIKKKINKEKISEEYDITKISNISNKAIEKSAHLKFDKNKNIKYTKIKLPKIKNDDSEHLNEDVEEKNVSSHKRIINLNNVGALFIKNNSSSSISTKNGNNKEMKKKRRDNYVDNEIDNEFYDYQEELIDIEKRMLKKDDYIVIKNTNEKNGEYSNKMKKKQKKKILYKTKESKQIRKKKIKYETKINCFNSSIQVRKKRNFPILNKKRFSFIGNLKNKSEIYYIVSYCNEKKKKSSINSEKEFKKKENIDEDKIFFKEYNRSTKKKEKMKLKENKREEDIQKNVIIDIYNNMPDERKTKINNEIILEIPKKKEYESNTSLEEIEKRKKTNYIKYDRLYLVGKGCKLENFSEIYEMKYAKMHNLKYKKINKKLKKNKLKLLSKSHINIHLFYNNKECTNVSNNINGNIDTLGKYESCNFNNIYFSKIKNINKIDNLKLLNYLVHKNKQNEIRSDMKKKSKVSKFFYFFTTFALIIKCIHIPSNNDND